MADLILFWHRKDLRTVDHRGLTLARQRSPKVVGVFCLDPQILQGPDLAPVRLAYLLGCLRELAIAYRQTGSHLLILHDRPEKAIPHLAETLGARAVYWHHDVEPYSQDRDRRVAHGLQEIGVGVECHWDQLLHAPGEVLSQQGQPYTVYTPFWKNWSKQPKERPYPPLAPCEPLLPAEISLAERQGGIKPLPLLEDLGHRWDGPWIIEPGTQAAQQRLEQFCTQAIFAYDGDRNFPALPGTSSLSAALKFGAIGIRTVWHHLSQAQGQCQSEEDQQGVQTWQQELAWREFYQHCLYFFPQLAAGPYRAEFRAFPWEDRPDRLAAWGAGQTGYPIVDAAMRQLQATGWMHNRCRMIVASFLTKDLILDWRKGEAFFMQHLIDGDLAANNGGWQWSASSGMDPKPLRIFNPASQAQKFDPEADYIRQWVPEIAHLATEILLTGTIPPLIRKNCGYPAPIVDHAVQQRHFKALYQGQKQA